MFRMDKLADEACHDRDKCVKELGYHSCTDIWTSKFPLQSFGAYSVLEIE